MMVYDENNDPEVMVESYWSPQLLAVGRWTPATTAELSQGPVLPASPARNKMLANAGLPWEQQGSDGKSLGNIISLGNSQSRGHHLSGWWESNTVPCCSTQFQWEGRSEWIENTHLGWRFIWKTDQQQTYPYPQGVTCLITCLLLELGNNSKYA